jgi:hypothetical protein
MAIYRNDRELAEQVRASIGHNGTQKQWAEDIGISTAYLSDFLNGNRGAGPAILKALGYEATPYYRKAEK